MAVDVPIPSLHAKLALVMAEADRIPKNGKAPREMGGYDFVQVGDAADAIRKALAAQRISMLPSAVEVVDQTEHATKSGGSMTTITVRTTWTLVDGDSGETAQIQSLGTGADTGDKYSPKAQTNAMKYALLMGFLLSTGDDPELSKNADDRRARRDTAADAAVARQGFAPRQAAPPQDEFNLATAFDAGLIGKAEKGTADADFELRPTPDGHRLAFRLSEGRHKIKVIVKDTLAEMVAEYRQGLEGQTVTAWGEVGEETFDKPGKNPGDRATTITYNVLHLSRVKAGPLDLTAPDVDEPDTDDDFDAGWTAPAA